MTAAPAGLDAAALQELQLLVDAQLLNTATATHSESIFTIFILFIPLSMYRSGKNIIGDGLGKWPWRAIRYCNV